MPKCFFVGEFKFYPEERVLIGAKANVIKLQPKTADTLLVLVENDQRYTNANELMERVWTSTYVEVGSVYLQIKKIRELLGEEAISCEKNKGYKLTLPCVVSVEQGPKSSSKRFVISFVLSLLLISLFWSASFFDKEKDRPKELPQTQLISFLKGQELDIFVSKHYISFVHRLDESEDFSIYLQKKSKGAQPIKLISSDAVNYYGPTIDDKEEYLYFQSIIKDNKTQTKEKKVTTQASLSKCGIWRIKLANVMAKKMDLRQAELLFDCGQYQFTTTQSLSPDQQSLYFSYTASEKKPSTIMVLDLQSKSVNELIMPSASSMGDWGPTVSPDGQYLAFIRGEGRVKSQIMLFTLSSGEIKQVDDIPYTVERVAWRGSHNQLIYKSAHNEFKAYELKKDEYSSVLSRHDRKVSFPFVYGETIYFSEGQLVVSDVVESNDQGFTFLDKLTSPYDDQIYRCNQENCYFLSSRNGFPQIFKQNTKGEITQFSQFTQRMNIADLMPAFDDSQLLFLNGHNQLFEMDLIDGSINPLLVGEQVESAQYSCIDNSLFASIKVGVRYDLFHYKQGSKKLLSRHAQQLKMDCWNSQEVSLFFVNANKKSFYRYQLKEQKLILWLSELHFVDNFHWDIKKLNLLRLRPNHIVELWRHQKLTKSQKVKIIIDSIVYGKRGEWVFVTDFAGELGLRSMLIN